jgi:hypothetical protein
MSGTTSNIFNTGANLAAPSGALLMPDYDVVIGADASTAEWWHPDTGFITDAGGGAISAMATQKTSGGTNLSQASAASQPSLLTNALNGRNALAFRRQTVGAPDRFLYTFPAGAGISWTKIMVLRDPTGGAANGNVWSGGTTGPHRLEFAFSANDGEHILTRMGPSLAASVIFKPRPINTWFLVMSAFDHVAGQAAISVNGGAWALSSTTGVVVDGTATSIGALASDGSNAGVNVDVAMIGLDTTALHLAGNAAKLAVWKQLVRDDFGLSIA